MTGAEALQLAQELHGLMVCDPFYSEKTHPHGTMVKNLARYVIERETPVVPVVDADRDTNCPCGWPLSEKIYGIAFVAHTRYCPGCGRPLDWSKNLRDWEEDATHDVENPQ